MLPRQPQISGYTSTSAQLYSHLTTAALTIMPVKIVGKLLLGQLNFENVSDGLSFSMAIVSMLGLCQCFEGNFSSSTGWGITELAAHELTTTRRTGITNLCLFDSPQTVRASHIKTMEIVGIAAMGIVAASLLENNSNNVYTAIFALLLCSLNDFIYSVQKNFGADTSVTLRLRPSDR